MRCVVSLFCWATKMPSANKAREPPDSEIQITINHETVNGRILTIYWLIPEPPSLPGG